MQLCSRGTASSCSRVVSCSEWIAAAALMSAMLPSSSVRAADSSAKSRYSRSLQSHAHVASHRSANITADGSMPLANLR